MSIRWMLVAAIASLLITDCGSRSDSSNECPDGYTSAKVCVECGIAGGCAKSETKCAQVCSNAKGCDNHLFCFDNLCQVGGCI